MTERTIRNLAKELAGIFYESRRTPEFRNGEQLVTVYHDVNVAGKMMEVPAKIPFKVAYPTIQHYIRAWWPHFIEPARKMLVAMLAMPDSRVSPLMKERISNALIEDREKELKYGGKYLYQRELELPNERA